MSMMDTRTEKKVSCPGVGVRAPTLPPSKRLLRSYDPPLSRNMARSCASPERRGRSADSPLLFEDGSALVGALCEPGGATGWLPPPALISTRRPCHRAKEGELAPSIHR